MKAEDVRLRVGALAAAFLAFSLPASRASALDVSHADIDGVRLYMTPSKVMGLLRKSFSDSCKVHKSDDGKLIESVVCIRSIYALSVVFTPSHPSQGMDGEVATDVQLDATGAYAGLAATPTDHTQFHDAAIAKYGPPDIVDGTTEVWCVSGRTYSRTCGDKNPMLILELSAVIELKDDRPAEQLERSSQTATHGPPPF
jgi:hypothetical protein